MDFLRWQDLSIFSPIISAIPLSISRMALPNEIREVDAVLEVNGDAPKSILVYDGRSCKCWPLISKRPVSHL